jgi:hypothetical protein
MPLLARCEGILRSVATYTVNERAVTHARKLIDARQYVLDSNWGEAQPNARPGILAFAPEPVSTHEGACASSPLTPRCRMIQDLRRPMKFPG